MFLRKFINSSEKENSKDTLLPCRQHAVKTYVSIC